MAKRKIELLFSDVSFGCDEFGYIPKPKRTDPDDHDTAYARHVRKQTGQQNWHVVNGVLYQL
jgi:hypothetical protein